MSYSAPNPYVEGVPYKGNAPATNSNSIMGMIGETPRGDSSKPILVTSWPEFIEKFALGCNSPFLANSYLSYSVYGFFQNGGSLLYVQRVLRTDAVKASYKSGDEVLISAKDEGAWGNNLKITFTKTDTENSLMTVSVFVGTEEVERYSELSYANADFTTTINGVSDYLVFATDFEASDIGFSGSDTVKTLSLTNGTDGSANTLTDESFTSLLPKFNLVHNLSGLSVPGNMSNVVIKALNAYCKGKPILPIFELPQGISGDGSASTKAFIASCEAKGTQSAFYEPWLEVVDPLSSTGAVKLVPPSGHMMGVIARTIDKKGEWEAAAGTEAVVKGVVGVKKEFDDDERGKLNSMGINVILPKPNYGIVSWGARSMTTEKGLEYVSNLTLDYTIRREINDGMQRFEFRQNNQSLWVDITAEIEGMLETKRLAGAFAGTTKETCYYVLCDSSLNTQAVIDKGQVICEVGYAANKPAEFIIVRVAHQLS